MPVEAETAKDGYWVTQPGPRGARRARRDGRPRHAGRRGPRGDHARGRRAAHGVRAARDEGAAVRLRRRRRTTPTCPSTTASRASSTPAPTTTTRRWGGGRRWTRPPASRCGRSAAGPRREPMPWALVRLALSSTARLSVVPAQDLLGLGSEARMNTPGHRQRQLDLAGGARRRSTPSLSARVRGAGSASRTAGNSPNSLNFPNSSTLPAGIYLRCRESGGLMAGESARAAAHTKRVKAEQVLQQRRGVRTRRGGRGIHRPRARRALRRRLARLPRRPLAGTCAGQHRPRRGRAQWRLRRSTAKSWSGDVEVKGGALRQDGKRRARHVIASAAAAMAVGELVPGLDPRAIHPVICFARHGADLRLVPAT